MTVAHFLIHWLGFDYGLSYGRFAPYDALSGLLGIGIISGVGALIRRTLSRHHGERLAQEAQHHREHMAQLKAQHDAQVNLAEKHHQELLDRADVVVLKPVARAQGRKTGGM